MSEVIKRNPHRFDASNRNLDIWLRNEKTDATVSPDINKATLKRQETGAKLSAINPTYMVKRLTAEFGPVGKGWGIEVVDEQMLTGAPIFLNGTEIAREIVHRLRIQFWWIDPSTKERHSFPQFGQTTFVSRNKYGATTDEDAPKKSLTDAMTKAASWLGIGGDVHLGLWDDSRYAAERREEAAEQRDEREDRRREKNGNQPHRAENDNGNGQGSDNGLQPGSYVTQDGKIAKASSGKAWLDEWMTRINTLMERGDFDALDAAFQRNKDAIEATREAAPKIAEQVTKAINDALAKKNGGDGAPAPAWLIHHTDTTKEPDAFAGAAEWLGAWRIRVRSTENAKAPALHKRRILSAMQIANADVFTALEAAGQSGAVQEVRNLLSRAEQKLVAAEADEMTGSDEGDR